MIERLNLLRAMEAQNPNDPFTKYAIAMEYVRLNDLTLAIEVFEELMLHWPKYLPTYYQAGKTYELNGALQKAKVTYERGIALANELKDFKTSNELETALDEL